MRLSQYIERKPERRNGSRRKTDHRTSVMTHGIFVPMVTVWGAALFGLSVMVLPAIAIERMAMVTGLGPDLGPDLGDAITRFAFAGVAAVIGAALAFVIAGAVQSAAIRRAHDDTLVSAVHSRRSCPIDPASELGSESLDAPLEGMPFARGRDDEHDALFVPVKDAQPDDTVKQQPHPELVSAEKSEQASERKPTLGELSMRGYEIDPPEEADPSKGNASKKKGKVTKDELVFTHKQFQNALIESCEGATCEAEAEAEVEAGLPERPEQLDLGEFAQMPGRNAVWVEEQPEAAAASPLMARAARVAVPTDGALEKLRQTPAEELSLVEMVERFAAALHERQQADRERAPTDSSNRDAALAEALKALKVFTSQDAQRGAQQGEASYEPTPDAEEATDNFQVAATERELREALAKLQDLRGAA